MQEEVRQKCSRAGPPAFVTGATRSESNSVPPRDAEIAEHRHPTFNAFHSAHGGSSRNSRLLPRPTPSAVALRHLRYRIGSGCVMKAHWRSSIPQSPEGGGCRDDPGRTGLGCWRSSPVGVLPHRQPCRGSRVAREPVPAPTPFRPRVARFPAVNWRSVGPDRSRPRVTSAKRTSRTWRGSGCRAGH